MYDFFLISEPNLSPVTVKKKAKTVAYLGHCQISVIESFLRRIFLTASAKKLLRSFCQDPMNASESKSFLDNVIAKMKYLTPSLDTNCCGS